MNFSKEIIAIIDNLCQKFGIAIDWTSANVMPYLEDLCKRFVQFEIQTSIFWIVFMVTLCLIFWIITAIFIHKAKKDDWYDPMGTVAIASILITAVWSFVTIIVIGIQVYDILTAINIPEKLIYDYITNAINNKLQ